MFRIFTIDPTPIKDQLIGMMEDCMAAARKQTKAAVEEIPLAPAVTVINKDIAGLREQILANATILLPILQPEAIGASTTSSSGSSVTPKLHVLVSGAAPSIRAYVVHGHDASRAKTKFIFGDKANTASEALEILLDATMRLAHLHAEYDTAGYAVSVGGGGYVTHELKGSPTASEDVVFWGGSAEPSPILPGNVSFKSNGSSSGSERIYLSVKNPSVNGSFNQNGSAQDQGSIRGNRTSPNGSVNSTSGANGNGNSKGSFYANGLGVNSSFGTNNGSAQGLASDRGNGNGINPNGSFDKTSGSNGNGSFYANGLGVNSSFGASNGHNGNGTGVSGTYIIDSSLRPKGAGLDGSFGKNDSFQSNGSFYGRPVGMNGSFSTKA
ncbi:hypothetical protein LTR85_006552 [Meristemomyces frigidus]|nr:hypothetical protein LTR85_006552 [Meristemomyces frigidus]